VSSIAEHIKKSLKEIEKTQPDFFAENKDIIIMLISELYAWFDEFFGKRGDNYDYTGINCMKHREQRHHIEGIQQARKLFCKKYGNQYEDIVISQGEQHVRDDMGDILFADDYKAIGFWKKIRGF